MLIKSVPYIIITIINPRIYIYIISTCMHEIKPCIDDDQTDYNYNLQTCIITIIHPHHKYAVTRYEMERDTNWKFPRICSTKLKG